MSDALLEILDPKLSTTELEQALLRQLVGGSKENCIGKTQQIIDYIDKHA
jgi:hypothetical protein